MAESSKKPQFTAEDAKDAEEKQEVRKLFQVTHQVREGFTLST